MTDANCIFCRIAKGEIPCAKIYEDDNVLAFLDLAPVHHGHTLVIPKSHYKDMLEVPSELGMHVFAALQKVAAAVMKATGAMGFNVMQNMYATNLKYLRREYGIFVNFYKRCTHRCYCVVADCPGR